MKCLEKRPADPWQSATELFAAIEASEDAKTPAVVEKANELIEGQFKITERVCRKLNRATVDPRIIGDHLSYVDNQLGSDVLVFFPHGLGLDHRDFEPILQRLPYGGVSPTLYGCEPERRGCISLSLADYRMQPESGYMPLFAGACRPCSRASRDLYRRTAPAR